MKTNMVKIVAMVLIFNVAVEVSAFKAYKHVEPPSPCQKVWVYKGVQYDRCIPWGWSTPREDLWCSLDKHYEEGKSEWKFCDLEYTIPL